MSETEIDPWVALAELRADLAREREQLADAETVLAAASSAVSRGGAYPEAFAALARFAGHIADGLRGEVADLQTEIACPFSLNLGHVIAADLRCPSLDENSVSRISHRIWGKSAYWCPGDQSWACPQYGASDVDRARDGARFGD